MASLSVNRSIVEKQENEEKFLSYLIFIRGTYNLAKKTLIT